MTDIVNESRGDQRAFRIAVVHQRPDEARRLIQDAAALLRPSRVMYFQTAREARSHLEQAFQAACDDCWFVVCGLHSHSWSTLVFLEWLRSRSQQTHINTALLTDTLRELLPLAVADRVDLRLLPTLPTPGQIQAWIDEVLGIQRMPFPTATS